ncbi:hypothetical protein KCU89_g93, partial [Aureobasidium melanogenum]
MCTVSRSPILSSRCSRIWSCTSPLTPPPSSAKTRTVAGTHTHPHDIRSLPYRGRLSSTEYTDRVYTEASVLDHVHEVIWSVPLGYRRRSELLGLFEKTACDACSKRQIP